ncbi:hypothetical protein C0Q70_20266 [Pomacea canaliculata]|uniref:Uncharacterized protein n=1 Tax=Pomacea canaliculata TaxID=400727 RepID=A0A2T7NF51_POMCA|nr:hypothetical protein C0Q70_20266 [Pomacea canaliculata]
MKRVWAHPTRWRYFINLTGQEFPLKTNKELVQILKAFRGANDISGTNDPQFHFRWKEFLPAPFNLTVIKGFVYIVASRGFVDYVIHSRVARDLLRWVQPSRNPDETFFSTLNHNPQLGVPGSFLDKELCTGKWVRTVCHFGVGDLYRLTHTPQLFANKFSYDFMPLAYDCLEEWYFEKVRAENQGVALPLNLSVYEHSLLVKRRYKGPVLMWD